VDGLLKRVERKLFILVVLA